MTDKEKSRWLMQYRTALDQERFLEEEVQSLSSDAQRMTTRLTGMPGAGPNPDRLSRAVERLDAARAQLDSQIEACMGIRCKVARAISAVPNLTAREVLRRRYVDGQSYAEIADEMMDYRGCGMSVLEMSHRSSMYQQIIDDAEATLRRLLSIPDNYRVLFLQGGATLQFAGIPMNLMRRGRAGYVVTGNFANKAYKEAAKYGEAVLLASSEDTNFDRIPDMADISARIAAEAAGDGLDYVYICQNNTIFGTMYHELPACGDVPLVADVSSCFLSQPLDVERYGLIYAGAQKNAGAAGVTVVIVRDDLIADGPAFAQTPQYMDLKTEAAKGSMLNTPNTFGIYVCGKVFRWV